MYDKCYFCLDQLPKLKKEFTASFFVNFGRSRGTKEPTYITVGEKSSCRLPFIAQLAHGIFLTAVFWARQELKKRYWRKVDHQAKSSVLH